MTEFVVPPEDAVERARTERQRHRDWYTVSAMRDEYECEGCGERFLADGPTGAVIAFERHVERAVLRAALSVPCPECGGEKLVTGEDSFGYWIADCGECNGSGRVPSSGPRLLIGEQVGWETKDRTPSVFVYEGTRPVYREVAALSDQEEEG